METELIAQPLLPSEIPADPVAWCRAFADRPGIALFDSALKDHRLGRYSFLGIDPFARLEADRGGVRLNGADLAAIRSMRSASCAHATASSLLRTFRRSRPASPAISATACGTT
jgi:anthranilate/para-aminobenzoate synthase component I